MGGQWERSASGKVAAGSGKDTAVPGSGRRNRVAVERGEGGDGSARHLQQAEHGGAVEDVALWDRAHPARLHPHSHANKERAAGFRCFGVGLLGNGLGGAARHASKQARRRRAKEHTPLMFIGLKKYERPLMFREPEQEHQEEEQQEQGQEQGQEQHEHQQEPQHHQQQEEEQHQETE